MKSTMIKAGGLLFASAFLATGCIGNYLKINSNPYEVTPEQMATDAYDVGATISTLCGTVISTDVNTAQFTDCLLGGPMGGYYSTTGAFEKTIDNFNATNDWTRVFMSTDRIIPALYTNIAELRKLTDDPIILAMADIIKVTAMHRVTDTYGPIPYSEIKVGDKLTVPYDSQEKVYEEMFKDLDGAISVLTEHKGEAVSANADPVFGGFADKWCKFANSLKFRLAMRIVYADKATAQEKINEVMNHPAGLMSSNDDNASLKPLAFGDKGNPIYTAVKYNQVTGSETGGDTHAAAEIVSYMNAYSDPRRPAYFIDSEFEGEKYVGALISAVKPPLSKTGRKYSGVKVGPKDPLLWMNACEVAFLKAEAVVLGLLAGNAEEFYNEGIRLSFEQWGVSGYEDYINNEAKAPVNYTPPAEAGGETRPEVLTELPVKWNAAATPAEQQERIIIQKWIANYHLGNEAWADHRRTGYPKFFPASDEGNKSNGVVDNVLGARRMPYPQEEKKENAEHYNIACSQLLKGKDNMATRIWWDCNPNVK